MVLKKPNVYFHIFVYRKFKLFLSGSDGLDIFMKSLFTKDNLEVAGYVYEIYPIE